MFGFRADGKRIKSIDPMMKLVPYIMKERNDAMVMTRYDINCSGMDEYIFKQRKENDLRFTYMHLLIAAMVRTFALRPKLNRFISNGRVYKRNKIQISFTVKKALSDEGEETNIKLTFTGKEDIFEIKKMMDEEIAKNTKVTSFNDTDALTKFLTVVPAFLIKFFVWFLLGLDKLGLWPKKLIEVSPFHTSMYLTNMKSIKMNYVYHHIYNVGTTSIFIAMGKEKYQPVVLDADENKLGAAKIMEAGIVIDERIADGLYYGNSMREFMKIISNPSILETGLESIVEDLK